MGSRVELQKPTVIPKGAACAMPLRALKASKMLSFARTPLAKPATLADIGRAAVGVSAMSASAVLNGARTSTRIAAETRNKILEEAARLRAPQDISVAGFDDTLAARTSVPQLTTVRQPLRAMGGKAVELLLGIDPASSTLGNIVFPTQPITRASVAPPPSKPISIPRLA